MDDWEKEKFEREFTLRQAELEIERRKLAAERNRAILVGVLVPISLAVITGVPAIINGMQERNAQRATFEASLIIDAISIAEPAQAAINLGFLVDAGLITGSTAENLSEYLGSVQQGPGPTRID